MDTERCQGGAGGGGAGSNIRFLTRSSWVSMRFEFRENVCFFSIVI